MGGIPIGVLALQGDFSRHERMLHSCGAEVKLIRKPSHLEQVRGLVIPGGESTVLSRLMGNYRFYGPLMEFAERIR